MKCSNCGTELEQGAKFCQLCGQGVEASAVAGDMQGDAMQDRENAAQGYGNTSQGMGASGQQDIAGNMMAGQAAGSGNMPNGKKKGRAGLKVAVGAAAVIVVGAVAFAAPKLYQKIKATNMNPTEYYQYVEKKNRDKGLNGAMDYYDQALNSVWNENGYNKNINMKISASDTAKNMLSMTGLDFSNLADIEVDETINMQENEMAIQMAVNANSDRLLSYNMYCNDTDQKFYVQVPEMSEGYMDLSDVMKEVGEETENGAVAFSARPIFGMMNMSDILKMYPKASDIKAIYNRYTDLYIDSVKDVQKAGGAYTADGVTQEANQYTVILSGGELEGLTQKVVAELKNDENVKNIIENIDEEAYTSFQERLEEIEADTGADSETTVTMETRIAADETIIGRNFTVDDGANKLNIYYLCTTDGDKFGAEFAVNLDGEELVQLTGNGTIKSKKISGDFVLGVGETLAEEASLADPSSVLKITLADYDCSKISEGSASGSMVISTGAVARLANFSLKYDFTTVKYDGSGTLSVLMGQDVMLTVDVKVTEGEKLTDIAPKDGDKIYNFSDDKDVEEYSKDFDEDKFLEEFLEKLGVDVSGLMGLVGQMYGDALLDDLAS